jgi:nitroimidazol reductase NimA-like FMN-containing flavoprotein (pyridoxamine 5'-phosphate oxidase superfamily)
MKLTMSAEAREQFLGEARVAVISVAAEPDRAPLTVPIWYDYSPGGEVVVVTASSMRKARLIGAAGRFSICVQQDQLPYKYVSVEGPVTYTGPSTHELRLAIAARYFEPQVAEAYAASDASAHEDLQIRMRPERWSSFDTSLAGDPGDLIG